MAQFAVSSLKLPANMDFSAFGIRVRPGEPKHLTPPQAENKDEHVGGIERIRIVAGMPFRTCLPDQEEEATNLGGILLLPRPLLLKAALRGLSVDEIAIQNGLTTEMARFRFNKSGVAKQAEGRGRRPKTSVS